MIFCDLVGSTSLSGRLDPEELSEIIRNYRNAAADVVRRRGGHIAQFLGDGLIAYFGYPVGQEDDAQRAVRAALEIVEAVTRLGSRMSQQLQVRAAVHTGLALVGMLSDESQITIVGEAPNLAGILHNVAEPDTVVISNSTHRLVEGFFVCRHLGAHRLKGIQAPLDLYSVLGESGIQSSFERAVARGLTPFVSREAELNMLLGRWSLVDEGSGQVILLSGEAGIGKSRLLRTLREQTAGEVATDLTIRCSQYYQDSALYPFIDFFRRFLRFESSDSSETKIVKLERALDGFGFGLEDTVPLFAELLSVPTDRYPAALMTPQRRKQRIFEEVLAWLFKLAQHNPTRLIVEDLHWADPSTLELLGLLVDRVPHTQMFAAIAFRSGFIPPWPMQPHMTHVALDRLSRDAAEMMVSNLADGKLPPVLIREIVEKTEGVPLFVEELTRMVLESESFQRAEGHHELTSSPLPLAIPSTLYESLMARLDRLGTAKQVAQIAAVIGKEFSYDLLREVSQLEETKLTGALNRLVDSGLFEQHLMRSRNVYRFKHALIRDAAYDSLLKKRRRKFHQRAAEVLRERFKDIVDAQPELLATHFAEAGLISEAVPYYLQAGQRAIERSADLEAIHHLTRGLELLNLLPESSDRLRNELLFQISLGTALIAIKGFSAPEVERAYSRARQLCRHVGEAPQLFPALSGLWMFYTSRGEHATARDLAEHCLRIAQSVGDSGLLAHAHHILGTGFIATADLVLAQQNFEQAIESYDPEAHRSLIYTYGHDTAAVALVQIAWPLWLLGYPDLALARCRKGQALAQDLNHPYTSLTVAAFATWVYQFHRQAQEVEELASRTISISTEHGFVFYHAYGLIMRGWALAERGQVLEGVALMRAGLDEYRANGGGSIKPSFLSLLAGAYGKLGQFDQAFDALAEAQDLADQNGERWWQAELYRIKGELILARDGSSASANSRIEAEGCFRDALGVARKQKARSLELRAATSLCRLWMAGPEHSQGRELLQETLDSFEEGFGTPDLIDAKGLMEAMNQ